MLNRLYQYISGAPLVNPVMKEPHPLFAAASAGNLPAISAITNYFQDLDMQDEDGNTPLVLAAGANHQAAVRILFNAGANIEARGYNGYTALAAAAFVGSTDAAATLIAYGADIEARCDGDPLLIGRTPLMIAVWNGHREMVMLLLAAGAGVNERDGDTNTPLLLAVERGQTRIIGMLLQAGALPKLAGNNGMTPHSLASSVGRFDMVALLQTDARSLANMDFRQAAQLAPACDDERPVMPVVEIAEEPVEDLQEVAVIEDNLDSEPEDLPDRYIDPISQECMSDPITLSNGQTFDRESLRKYFESQGNPDTVPCPLTRYPVPIVALTYGTNIKMKEEIVERQQQREARKRERAVSLANLVPDGDVRVKRQRYFERQGLFASPSAPPQISTNISQTVTRPS